MTTNIKGAIEVWRQQNSLPKITTYTEYSPAIRSGTILEGIWLSHADLEAYVQERERKAFEAGRRMRGWPSLEFYYSEFEDFKKEQGE